MALKEERQFLECDCGATCHKDGYMAFFRPGQLNRPLRFLPIALPPVRAIEPAETIGPQPYFNAARA